MYLIKLFYYTPDGVRVKQEIKEEPAEDDVVYVKTEPATETQCRCINMAPMHFNCAVGKCVKGHLFSLHYDTTPV